jgi:hypothetical protein
MAFDPDAYLAEKQTFDPDAYLGENYAPVTPPQKKGFKVSDMFAPVIAPLEVGAQMATGLAGQVAGGVRGLYNLATGEGLDASANAVRQTQEAMTYQPRTDLGQGLGAAVAYPFQKGMEATKAAGGAVGEYVGGEQGRLAGEAIGEQVIPVAGTVIPGMQALKAACRGPSAARRSQPPTASWF